MLPDFWSSHIVEELKTRAISLMDSYKPEESESSVFSTVNQKADDYFLSSAGEISFFLEEKADKSKPMSLSINKIGHAMHDLDPVFRKHSRSERVATVLRDLGYRHPQPVQSMYILKAPFIGGEVVPHQVRERKL